MPADGPQPLLSDVKGDSLDNAKAQVKSEYDGKVSDRTFHLFINETDEDADLYWFYDGGEQKHGTIAPKGNLYVGKIHGQHGVTCLFDLCMGHS